MVHLKDQLTISCETDHPDAKVELHIQSSRIRVSENILSSSKGRIVQDGQRFNFTAVRMSDRGMYICVASLDGFGGEKKMVKGHLIVSPGK